MEHFRIPLPYLRCAIFKTFLKIFFLISHIHSVDTQLNAIRKSWFSKRGFPYWVIMCFYFQGNSDHLCNCEIVQCFYNIYESYRVNNIPRLNIFVEGELYENDQSRHQTSKNKDAWKFLSSQFNIYCYEKQIVVLFRSSMCLLLVCII